MKIILHCGYKTRHKGAVYASPMAMPSYCMSEQSSTKTYQVMYKLLEVYSVLLLIRFIDQSKTRDRPYVRILTEKCSTFHPVPLNLWSILLLIKKRNQVYQVASIEKHTFISIIHQNLSSLKQIGMFWPCFVILYVDFFN